MLPLIESVKLVYSLLCIKYSIILKLYSVVVVAVALSRLVARALVRLRSIHRNPEREINARVSQKQI